MRNSLVRSIVGAVRSADLALQRYFTPHIPALQLAPIAVSPSAQPSWDGTGAALDDADVEPFKPFGDIFEQSVWNMAVPKSKISRSRKRMKHKQHIPPPVGWSRCDKCGEPKRPHRICTKNSEVCGMRADEYEAYLGGGSSKA